MRANNKRGRRPSLKMVWQAGRGLTSVTSRPVVFIRKYSNRFSKFITASGQSLTKFRTETTVTHSDGMTFIDHLIIPLNSTLEIEGYMNREKIEKIILKIISLLK